MSELQRSEPTDNNDFDMIEECLGCPRCGERRVDWLVWLDEEQVECSTCGFVYAP